mmetsp:Transcript_51451/g.148486  ORF Transcript_51451/g.148486 Transcript_51451/m.148486 type:complete len:134 (-) Transcript_51451:261-662(-)
MRSNLNGSITCICHTQFDQGSALIERNRLAFLNQHGTRGFGVILQLTELFQGRTGQKGSFESEIHISVHCSDWRMNRQELGSIRKSGFDLHIFYQLSHTRKYLTSTQQGLAHAHQRSDILFTIPDFFHHLHGN